MGEGLGVVDKKTNKVTVASVGVAVLEMEMESMMAKGKKIDEDFGGWEDALLDAGYLMLEDEDDDDDDDDDKEAPQDSRVETNVTQHNVSSMANATSSALPNGTTTSPTKSSSTKPDHAQGKQLRQRMLQAESALEEAVVAEDYEKAAELEEEIKSTKARLEKMGMSAEQLERYRRQLAEAESSLERAVQTEDYEEADRLEAKIKYVKSKLPPEEVTDDDNKIQATVKKEEDATVDEE